MTRFAELAVTTNFSFLRGGSHPEEMVRQARHLGLAGIAVADRNSLAGVVRGHIAARDAAKEALEEAKTAGGEPPPEFRYAVGCRLVFTDGTPDILAWPADRAAYGRLCRLLTLGNRRAPKGECHLVLFDLLAWGAGLLLAAVPGTGAATALEPALARLRAAFPGAVSLLAAMPYGGGDRRRLGRLSELSRRTFVPLLASNDVLYHHPDRRPLQDVVTCIREHVTLAAAGRLLAANAERHLKPANEMLRLFRGHEEAVHRSAEILDRIGFSLDQLAYNYPDEPIGDAPSPQEELCRLTEEGARFRYPAGVPEKIAGSIAHELALIEAKAYAPYFLTVHDIVRFARSRGILCQGRGSAANSAVCYCLGITEVDPTAGDLLFERFISPERDEPPDIDVDFEHERREEVMQYIYGKYSRERTGIAATVITYRTRSAIREVGKVFGLSEDTIGALSGSVWGWSNEGVAKADARRAGLDPESDGMRRVLALSLELIGFPRHLSQHVGGFVITRDRLDEMVPIMNAAMPDRTNIEWDKDDLDAVGMMKVDVLALGMLSCIRRAFDFMRAHYGGAPTLATIPKEAPAVYRMLQRADSLGVFQVESRAQMTMLPRLRPKEFYDLVIEVAIVRPGPIQGNMVHPYLRRRQGLEDPHYPEPAPEHGPPDELEQVLGRTLGVPLFQEQAMKIAMVAARFTAAEADRLRRAMATFKRSGSIGLFRHKMIEGMVARGYQRDFAERCFRQIEGFGEYGFPESHAASFALLVYASAWLKCHYPDVFCAALLNAQPMGFYAPAQIVRDAREHGVAVHPPDVNFSGWDCTLEPEEGAPPVPAVPEPWTLPPAFPPPAARRLHRAHAGMEGDVRSTHAVRLGLRQVKGFSEDDASRLAAARGAGYDSVRDLWLRSGLPRAAIERLADADAFRSLGLDRRGALWAARGLGGERDRLPLFDTPLFAAAGRAEPEMALPPMRLGEQVVNDYRFLGLSLKAHPVAFLRSRLAAGRILESRRLAATPSGRRVTVAGLVLVRQRPGSASGVIFMTLEDETGIANIVVWPKLFERFRPVVLGARLVAVSGRVQNESGVVHVVADRLEDRTAMLAALSEEGGRLEALSRVDEVRRPSADARDKPARGARLARPARPEPAAEKAAKENTKVDALVDAMEEAAARARQAMPKGRNFH